MSLSFSLPDYRFIKRAALTLSLLLCLGFQVYAQKVKKDYCDSASTLRVLYNSYQCKWSFYELRDTIKGKILAYQVPNSHCGHWATASMIILKTARDTERILILCDSIAQKKGKYIRIAPYQFPPVAAHIPYYIEIVDPKAKKYIYRSNEFDKRVLKTTWGVLAE